MTTLAWTIADSRTMLRRRLRQMLRYPSLTVMLVGLPVVFLALFVYVLGGTLGAGLPGGAADRSAYANYVAPGVLLLTIAGAAQGTAISVAMDMTSGIIARFRTMAVARSSVLTGHVVGSMLQTLLSVVLVLGVALAIGFRPSAGVPGWLGALGVLVMVTFALTWLSVALGLFSKSVETASNAPMFLLLLPFIGSGFVPTDSMPTALRWFAEYQPFTCATESVRGLLAGTATGHDVPLTAAWCAGISLVSILWARHLYRTRPVR